MECPFRAARLDHAGADRAFALLRVLEPELSLENWTAFRAANRDADVVAIEDSRGYAHALFAHRVEHDLRHGRVLRLIALACSGFPSTALHEAIFTHGELLARERRCCGVILELAEQSQPIHYDCAARGLEASVTSRYARRSSSYFLALTRTDA